MISEENKEQIGKIIEEMRARGEIRHIGIVLDHVDPDGTHHYRLLITT